MQLAFTEQQQAFRQEIREWLAANAPAEPLKTFDTEEGFQQHREWEAVGDLAGGPRRSRLRSHRMADL